MSDTTEQHTEAEFIAAIEYLAAEGFVRIETGDNGEQRIVLIAEGGG